jgi:hypothetical protein
LTRSAIALSISRARSGPTRRAAAALFISTIRFQKEIRCAAPYAPEPEMRKFIAILQSLVMFAVPLMSGLGVQSAAGARSCALSDPLVPLGPRHWRSTRETLFGPRVGILGLWMELRGLWRPRRRLRWRRPVRRRRCHIKWMRAA